MLATRSEEGRSAYKAAPEVAGLRGPVRSQTNVLVRVDVGIASKVEPAILEILVWI